MLKFYIKVFNSSYVPDYLVIMMDLVFNWYDDRYLFEVLFSNTHTNDLKVKVKDLELLFQSSALKFFNSAYFPDHMIDLIYIWYDDRYKSKD